MITASQIKEKVESYDLSKPHHAQFRLCVKGEKFADQHRLVFNEIAEELTSTPQDFYSRAKSYLRNHKEIAFALRKMQVSSTRQYEDQEAAVLPALERIANFWEAAPALRFYAFYLSGKKAPFEALNKPGNVLRHFKNIGLNSSDTDLLRKLRNATQHPGYFQNDQVVSDKGEQICEFYEVLNLVDKIDEINRWVLMMTIYLILYNPQFTLMATSLLHHEYRTNQTLYANSLGPMYKLFGSPSQQEEVEGPKQSPPKLAVWITSAYFFAQAPIQTMAGTAIGKAISRKLSGAFSRAYNSSDMVRLIETFQLKSKEAAHEIRSIAMQLRSQADQQALLQFAEVIDQDAERRTDLNRKVDRKLVGFMIRQFNKKYTREQP